MSTWRMPINRRRPAVHVSLSYLKQAGRSSSSEVRLSVLLDDAPGLGLLVRFSGTFLLLLSCCSRDGTTVSCLMFELSSIQGGRATESRVHSSSTPKKCRTNSETQLSANPACWGPPSVTCANQRLWTHAQDGI